jgi:hypothetical protein
LTMYLPHPRLSPLVPPFCSLNQEKMKKEVALLQRQLEAKERKMMELMKNAGSMPALKQHYDRVLAELEAQRDTLVAERKSLMEVRRRLVAVEVDPTITGCSEPL